MSLVERRTKKFTLPSKTKQEFRQECDINMIMKKFKRVQGSDFLQNYNFASGGHFGDFTTVGDYQSALKQINDSRALFMALPSKVRARFENDPAQFLDFVHNPANAEEMVSLGFAVKRETVPASKTVPVVGSQPVSTPVS